ncbi:MAG TPA: aminotransferase class I/II-fold pyridoxal phosphate-dependent enzyme [Longimicrobiales bacterium]|nr:aminotransferase class I/II-fold pyridoxal phosphate-dependent enzyme [Longimicrobiales bacterium]
MSTFHPFAMERWQSTYENRVELNLSESGVDPLTLAELLEIGGADIDELPLGYGQSNGSDPLRSHIAAMYDGARDDGVVVCNGSAEANFIAIWELVRPGDEIAVVVPTYMQTYGLAQNVGARVIEIPLHEELGWQPDPDEIARAVTARTRLIVVTNPSNPTGAVLSGEAHDAIVHAARRTGAWILADEVYRGAEISGRETRSFFGTHDRVIATGSLSKGYGLPGLRIGWTMSDARTAETLWARSDYTTIAPGELTDRLAAIALDPAVRPKLLERTHRIIRTGLDTMTTWLGSMDGFHWRDPDAGAICFVRYDADIGSDELAERLRSEQSVLIVPGSHFGLDRYVRFGLGMPTELFEKALERVGETLRQVSAAA